MTETRKKSRRSIVNDATKRLISIRRDLGYGIPHMASVLGITENAYRKNESGENLINLQSMLILQEQYNISIDWFLFGKGPMRYKKKVEEAHLINEKEALEKEKEELAEEVRTLRIESANIKKAKKAASTFLELATAMPDISALIESMQNDPEMRYRVLLDYYAYKKEKIKE